MRGNEYGQPVGTTLEGWDPPRGLPDHRTMTGRTVALEPLDPSRHAAHLFEALEPASAAIWTYMGFGPFIDSASLQVELQRMVDAPDWLPYTFVVDDEFTGFASYLRIQPRDGTIEIGSIVFSPQLQRTTAATEGLYLMMRHAFDQGYRRVEWKCDDLNAPSIRAAERLGFTYEGTFRQATHYKGRNRDTAWYAIVDREWPVIKASFDDWLAPENFDDDGRQRSPLEGLR